VYKSLTNQEGPSNPESAEIHPLVQVMCPLPDLAQNLLVSFGQTWRNVALRFVSVGSAGASPW
jgi:hypothetical protein